MLLLARQLGPTNNIPVTIILPAYNAGKFISETIESVLQQTYTNWELLAINDGSTDQTGNLLTNFSLRDKRIKVFHKNNSGVSASRNLGLHSAKGNFIFFLDADDVWNKNNVEEKVNYFITHKVDAVYSSCEMIDENSVSCNTFLKGSSTFTVDDILLSKGNYTTAPSGLAITAEVAQKIGDFDIRLSNNADTDYFIRILAAGFKFGYIQEMLWKYRTHSRNMSGNVSLLEKDLLYLYHKSDKNKLFRNFLFKQKCYSNIYFVLAGSWWKVGNNKLRGIYFLMRSVCSNPFQLYKLLSK